MDFLFKFCQEFFCGKKRKRTETARIHKDYPENLIYLAKNASKYHNYKYLQSENFFSIINKPKSNQNNNYKNKFFYSASKKKMNRDLGIKQNGKRIIPDLSSTKNIHFSYSLNKENLNLNFKEFEKIEDNNRLNLNKSEGSFNKFPKNISKIKENLKETYIESINRDLNEIKNLIEETSFKKLSNSSEIDKNQVNFQDKKSDDEIIEKGTDSYNHNNEKDLIKEDKKYFPEYYQDESKFSKLKIKSIIFKKSENNNNIIEISETLLNKEKENFNKGEIPNDKNEIGIDNYKDENEVSNSFKLKNKYNKSFELFNELSMRKNNLRNFPLFHYSDFIEVDKYLTFC